jgi:hypothetical protein
MRGGGVKHGRRGSEEDERFVPGGERFVISQIVDWRSVCSSLLPRTVSAVQVRLGPLLQ